VEFWAPLAEEAAALNIHLLLENMWEDDPTIITDVLAQVNNPFLQGCLDIAHATLFSTLPVQQWVNTFTPFLFCCHLNNHDGLLDQHWPLHQGIIDYNPILSLLRALPRPPLLTLEMPCRSCVEGSLRYLEIDAPV
jgi:sugar phosphate isomerase/epimerase